MATVRFKGSRVPEQAGLLIGKVKFDACICVLKHI